MGARAVLDCLERSRPSALVGLARAHVLRWLRPRAFAELRLCVRVGGGFAPGSVALERVRTLGAGAAPFPVLERGPADAAAVLFTSGSTGPAKGVVYTHGNFAAQLAALQGRYGLVPGAVDCACFPLFALFDNALGLTSVFPEMDAARPGSCAPAAIVAALEESGATFCFGSPAIWKRVVPWLEARGRGLARPLCVAIAGAPVAPELVLRLRALLPAGSAVHTPYGATEALPVSDVGDAELALVRARVERGEGACIGRALPGLELALVRVTDEPIATWDERLRVAPGEPGEVCVKGPVVTRAYLGDERATRAAKIADGDGLWHRMGDVARLDGEGRLWFLGRKSHRVETERGVLFPVPLENAFDATPGVARTALVGVGPRGRERPHLVVEPAGRVGQRELLTRLQERAHALEDGRAVTGFLFHPAFPVDARHNAKIRREDLKRWAEKRVR